MTNEELKDKICDIIAPYVSVYGDDERISDALIAAGIGDVKKEKFEADHYWNMWQGALVELERAERRAEVAENELKLYKLAVKIWQERYSDIRCFNFNIALRQAEKELAEEENEKET